MRGGRLFSIVIVVVAVVTDSLPGSATSVEPGARPERRRYVTSAELFGRHTGIATTRGCVKGRRPHPCRTHLYLTRDLGETWRDVTPPPFDDDEPIYAVFWRGRRRGWAAAGFCDRPLAAFTTDGGRSWAASGSEVSAGCHAGSGATLDFVDARHGFYAIWDPVGEGSNIQRSRDGGESWSRGNGIETAVGPVNFRDRRHGYLASTEFGHRLYSTRDGGRSWIERKVSRPRSYRHADRVYDVPVFTRDARIVAVSLIRGRREDVAFYEGRVGTRSWRLASIARIGARSPRSDYAPPLPTSVASVSTWWIVYGRGDHVALTRDGGKRWIERNGSLRGSPSTVSAVGGRSAWVVTATEKHDFLHVTRNGGRTWHLLRPWLRRGN